MSSSEPTVLKDIGVLARCLADGAQSDIHEIHDAAVAWQDGRIVWVGPESGLPAEYGGWRVLRADGMLVVPGLVDCHTHLAFGGWRADEFVDRIRGRSYLDIAKAGGGIQRTVVQTRLASLNELIERSAAILDEMLRLGVTTVEAKSGYGLDRDTEIKQLKVYEALSKSHPVRLVPTLLAHKVPPEYADRRREYVSEVVGRVIREAAEDGLARYCDVFIEDSAFHADEGREILEAARDAGLGLKIHADQLSNLESAALAAELGAASADHLERISDRGIAAMAESRTVAVSLPIATLYLGAGPMPARRLMDAGVAVAVATDFNPGSAPSYHLPFAMTLACVIQRMTPAEVLKGATVLAARAIGLEREVGSVEVGKQADLVVIEAESVDQWLYHFRPNAARTVILNGNAYST